MFAAAPPYLLIAEKESKYGIFTTKNNASTFKGAADGGRRVGSVDPARGRA
jgi:hypothetical protein